MNAFLQVADQQQNAASKARDRAAERRLAKLVVKSEADAPMVASAADKDMWEKSQLLRQYNAAIRQRRADLLAGPHGKEIGELLSLLENLAGSSPIALVRFVTEAIWLREADEDTRFGALSLISTEIMRYRVRQGLPPFDDSLPFSDEQPTAFEQIRYKMTGVGSWA